MAVLRTLICLAATTALLMQLAMAATYTVGGPNGFQYTTNHDVVEVSKAGYDACTTSNAVQSYNGGNTVITLSSPGKRYFICGTAGHCSQGMKVEVDTLATSSPPSATPSAPAPATPSTPSPKASPSTPTPVSSSAPETSSPSPAQSPKTAPKMSPTSPSSSPSSSPPLANVPSTESPATASPPGSSKTASPPGSSSATKTTTTLGFSLGMLMLLAL